MNTAKVITFPAPDTSHRQREEARVGVDSGPGPISALALAVLMLVTMFAGVWMLWVFGGSQ